MNQQSDQADKIQVETAYLEIFDCRQTGGNLSINSAAKNALGGLSAISGSYQQSSCLKVQFNPKALEFSAGFQREEKKRSNVDRNPDGIVEDADISKYSDAVTVNIQLIFDKTLLKLGSVQPEVEGFLAMVQNPYVRKVAFHWGSQYYVGKIGKMNAEYQFFNDKGIPLRATVTFGIELF